MVTNQSFFSMDLTNFLFKVVPVIMQNCIPKSNFLLVRKFLCLAFAVITTNSYGLYQESSLFLFSIFVCFGVFKSVLTPGNYLQFCWQEFGSGLCCLFPRAEKRVTGPKPPSWLCA